MSLVGHGSLPKHLGSAEHSCIYFIYEQGRGQQKVRCLRLVPRSEVLPWIQSVRRCFDDLGRCSASWWMCLGTATYRGTNMGELNAEATSKRSKPEVSLYPGDLVFFEFLLSASLNILPRTSSRRVQQPSAPSILLHTTRYCRETASYALYSRST